jgi:putative transposase
LIEKKIPLELKILGLALYIQLSSLRRAAKALSEIHKTSKTAIWKWVRKLSERLNINPPKIRRRLIALDETCVSVNRFKCWVYAAIDVDRNEILSMRVFPSRNAFTTKIFVENILKYCDGRPMFVVDGALWLREVLERPGLGYYVESFGERSLVESVYSSFKRRTSAFFNSINSNPLNRSERFRRSILCWNLFIKLFMLYYNHLRG